MFITQRKLRFLLPVAALFVIIRFLKERELIHSLVRVQDDNKAQVPQVQGGTAVDDGTKTAAAESSLTLTLTSTSTNSLPIPYGAISVGGCCGLGHRMTRLIPSVLYGVTHNQVVLVNWTDVEWNVLFNNTAQVKQGVKIKGHHYSNKAPSYWEESVFAKHGTGTFQVPKQSSTFDFYSVQMKKMFTMRLAQSIAKSLSENLSPLVLKFLNPIRTQYASRNHAGRGLHLCAHVREGNNETDFPSWRNIVDFNFMLDKTLLGMKDYVFSKRNGTATTNTNKENDDDKSEQVSVFVASDNENTRPWFEQNVPNNWHVLSSRSRIPKPKDGGHWFQHERTHAKLITKEQKNELMAETVADAFALGECDALFIPTYSSFNVIGIMLSQAARRDVFFLGKNKIFFIAPGTFIDMNLEMSHLLS